MTLNRPRFAPVNYLLGVFTGAVLVGAVWAWRSHSFTTLSRNDPALLFAPSNSVFVSPARLASYTRLSPEDLAFGEQQVQRMVKDRPEMGRDVRPNDPVWRFCAKAFAGAAIGERVYWDNSEPMTGYDCDHNGPYQGDHGYIRVRPDEAKGDKKGRPHPCEELWSLAVFELENIRGTTAFNDLWEKGLAGELDRPTWIRENARLEYDALLRTARLYEPLWLPMAKQKGLRSTPHFWNKDVPVNYNDWIARYDDPRSYPWDSWGDYYDHDIEPYVKSVKAWKAEPRNQATTSSTRNRATHVGQ